MSSQNKIPALPDNSVATTPEPSFSKSPVSENSSKKSGYKKIALVAIMIFVLVAVVFVIRYKAKNFFKKTMPNKKDLSEDTKKENK